MAGSDPYEAYWPAIRAAALKLKVVVRRGLKSKPDGDDASELIDRAIHENSTREILERIEAFYGPEGGKYAPGTGPWFTRPVTPTRDLAFFGGAIWPLSPKFASQDIPDAMTAIADLAADIWIREHPGIIIK